MATIARFLIQRNQVNATSTTLHINFEELRDVSVFMRQWLRSIFDSRCWLDGGQHLWPELIHLIFVSGLWRTGGSCSLSFGLGPQVIGRSRSERKQIDQEAEQ
jgi:hypothetical protein